MALRRFEPVLPLFIPTEVPVLSWLALSVFEGEIFDLGDEMLVDLEGVEEVVEVAESMEEERFVP